MVNAQNWNQNKFFYAFCKIILLVFAAVDLIKVLLKSQFLQPSKWCCETFLCFIIVSAHFKWNRAESLVLMYNLPHDLSNDLKRTILGNDEILGNS